ncbi:MAG: hypothetical protein R3F11_23105 [Verrucomicrobiales bacterium]
MATATSRAATRSNWRVRSSARALAIFLFQLLEEPDREAGDVADVLLDLVDLAAQLRHVFFRLERVVFRDALDLDFGQPGDVLVLRPRAGSP